MRAPILIAPASLLAFAVLVAPAGAGIVSVTTVDSCGSDAACSKYAAGHPIPVTVFEGKPGEASRLTVSRTGADFLLQDPGAPIEARTPCLLVDATSARCPVTEGEPGFAGVRLAMGDGDDQATIAGATVPEVILVGGDGNDTLAGGEELDSVDGGLGDDALTGGGGVDRLDFSLRTASVTIDLAAGTAGAADEHDTVSGFEESLGGSGDDLLRGAAAAETLAGGAGDDIVEGGPGADALFGGTGGDSLSGGRGADRLFGDPEQGDGIYTPTFPYGDDLLEGGAGADELYDTGGRNAFFGGRGGDLLEGGRGKDRLLGGGGNDRIDAKGGRKDRVDCGAGRKDRARTDRRDTRRRCERRFHPQ
jgi:Ca2+-binding RTX toxin-like protein